MKSKPHILRQAERLKRGEINRRRFIMSALATGVTLPTATSLAQRAEAAPKSGGVLRFGVADAHRLADIRAMATGNTLVEVGANGALIGDLAASFEPARRGLTWAFRLRPDVAFHDGASLNAQMVVAALSRADTPGLRGQVETLRVDGPNTVVFDLTHPNPDFAWVLSDPKLTIRAPSGAGTGAFVLTHSKLRRVGAHWKAGRGHFEALDLIALPDPAARVTALLNGEVDLIDDVDPRLFALLEHTPDIKLIETEAAALYGLARQKHTHPGIGRALSDATNRRDLAQKVLLGHGKEYQCTPACGHAGGRAPITLGKGKRPFPGESDMLSLIRNAASKQGLSVSETAMRPHFKTERVRLRPTVDWTLSDAMARRADPVLEALVIKARKSQNKQEKSELHAAALRHLETSGDVFALIADEIHAHSTRLSMPPGDFEAHRIAERGWFA